MKKLFLLFCALWLTTSSLWAYDFEVDGIFYGIMDDTTKVYVTNGRKYQGAVVIPESVTYNDTTYSVTKIGDWAFSGCTGLTSITIPNSVTSINGWYTFSGCTGLTSITIPNSVTSIGTSVFSDCTGLTSVTLSNRITTIGSYTFANCSSLTSIVIPDRVTSIGHGAFSGCTSLTSVTIGKRVSYIVFSNAPEWETGSVSSSSFRHCPNLKEFIVHEENETFSAVDGLLCNKAGTKLLFYPNAKASHYTLPSSITSIDSYAFYGSTSPFSLTIPNSVTEIGKSVFRDCTGLISVTIPNSVTKIGEYAFYGCSGLTSVTIPNSVTEIKSSTFYGCTGLTSVTIPNSVTTIGREAFYGCTGLTSITIPNKITKIEYGTFYNCTSLTEITIPNSVTSIGEDAFYGCSGLETIYSQNPTPPTVYDDETFAGEAYNYATLYVPTGSRSAYEDSDYTWWLFLNIEEMDFSGIEESIVEGITVVAQNGAIIVNGVDTPITIEVYNLQGQPVYRGNNTSIPVNERGIYIVRVQDRTYKVVL